MRAEVVKPRSTGAWTFLFLTYALTWLCWLPIVLTRAASRELPWLLFLILGGFGPSVAGIIMVHRTSDVATRREFWRRVIDPRRIPLRWAAVILLLYPLAHGLAYVIYRLAAGPPVDFSSAVGTLTSPLILIAFTLNMLVGGPLTEELGWRGFALDRLQARYGFLASSLILGVIWSAWHWPLFWMQDTFQRTLGFMTGAGFWGWTLWVIASALLYTWIYNHTERSILAMIAIHFMANFTVSLYQIPPQVFMIEAVLLVLMAGLVTVYESTPSRGGTTLRGPAQKGT